MADWVGALSQTLKDWKPEKVGFWFSSELTKKDEPHALLKKILLKNIQETDCREYYLLMQDGGANSLLNAALALRPSLSRQGHRLSVFH